MAQATRRQADVLTQDLTVDCEVHGATAEMTVRGDLDMAGAFKLEPAIDTVVRENTVDELVLDLAGVGFIDSAGVGALLASREDLTALGIRVSVARPSEAARRILEVTGTHRDLLQPD